MKDDYKGGDADGLMAAGGKPSKQQKVAALQRALEG